MYLLDLFKEQKQTLIVFEEDSKCVRILVTPKVDDAKTIFFGMVEYPKDRSDVGFNFIKKQKSVRGNMKEVHW